MYRSDGHELLGMCCTEQWHLHVPSAYCTIHERSYWNQLFECSIHLHILRKHHGVFMDIPRWIAFHLYRTKSGSDLSCSRNLFSHPHGERCNGRNQCSQRNYHGYYWRYCYRGHYTGCQSHADFMENVYREQCAGSTGHHQRCHLLYQRNMSSFRDL